jgi:hypothetical protein
MDCAGSMVGSKVLNFLLVFPRLYTQSAPNAGRRNQEKLDVDADCANHVDCAEAVRGQYTRSVTPRPRTRMPMKREHRGLAG